MKDEVRIHLHSDPGVPGTRWWAESDSGFTGGSDVLSDLVAAVQEWALADDIQVSFKLILEEKSFTETRYVTPIVHCGSEIFAKPPVSDNGLKVKLRQIPIDVVA